MSGGAGELRDRVKFSERDDVEDEYGNIHTGWRERCEVWANISPRLGGETVMAARLTGRQPVIIRVRQTPATLAISTDWKATNVKNGVEYNIRTAVDPYEGTVEHDKWRDMLAEAGVPA